MRVGCSYAVVSFIALILSFCIVSPVHSYPVSERYAFRLGGSEGGGGAYINLAVDSVGVSKQESVRGDVIEFIVTLHNKGESIGRAVTLRALSGKKVLGETVVFRYDWDVKDRMVVTVTWDTSKFEPGDYPVKIEAPLFGDADDFDNIYRLPSNIVLK